MFGILVSCVGECRLHLGDDPAQDEGCPAFPSLQLGQGVLVQVSPSLVKRQKTHFHDLPCGASVILGNNGFIWIYPTPEQKDEEAGGFVTNLEVRPGDAGLERCLSIREPGWSSGVENTSGGGGL